MKNVEQNTETLDNSDEAHLYLFFYLIPIFGFFPSLWTLYRGTRREQGELRKQGKLGGKSLLLPQPPQPPQLLHLSSSHQPLASSPFCKFICKYLQSVVNGYKLEAVECESHYATEKRAKPAGGQQLNEKTADCGTFSNESEDKAEIGGLGERDKRQIV